MNKLNWLILASLLIALAVGDLLSMPVFTLIKNLFPTEIMFVANSPIDGFMIIAYIMLAISFSIISFIAFLLSIFYLRDVFYQREFEFIVKAFFPAGILFVIGCVFGLWLYSQIMLPYFIMLNNSLGLNNLFNLFEVMKGLIVFSFILGIAFELPIVLKGLIRFGLIEVSFLKSKRYFVFVSLFIISCVITPTPDLLTSLIVTLPLYVLFELSLI